MSRNCDTFFSRLAESCLAVTYDEVRLSTNYSETLPDRVQLASFFSRNVPVKIPVASAAMDTVTESRMAIALAKLGGIGVIHRNLTVEEQVAEVRRVKFHLSGLIMRPITVTPDMTLKEVQRVREEREFSFHSFPVLNADGKLVGLITQTDFDFCENDAQPISTVMTREIITARPGTSLHEAHEILLREKKKVLPLVGDDGRLAGMYLFSDLKRIMSGTSDTYNVDPQGRLRVAAAIGTGEDALLRADALKDYVDVLVIDTAHGDSLPVFETVKAIKKRYMIDVVAGNVSRGESAKRLADAGVDGVKVGQGPGSICTTRTVAGVGCPQVTAIYEAAKALEGTDVPVCADGGIENSGDIPIAIGAGAHTVMLGKLLAGTTEAPGRVDFQSGTPMKRYRGMGSLAALVESKGSRQRYLESGTGPRDLVPEGVEAVVPYVGDLATVMHQYLGGLRKGMGYTGAATIDELRAKAEFCRITQAGLNESHVHGVRMLQEPPNYRRSE